MPKKKTGDEVGGLLIVESPKKIATIKKYLPDDYDVVASIGHIRELPSKTMGIDLETFEPEFIESPDKRKAIAALKKAIAKTKKARGTIILATDGDREGEAIAWHIATLFGLPLETTPRIVFHEITKTAIERAFAAPRPINMNMVWSQMGRQIIDKLVGYGTSPYLWSKMKGKGLSAGRVQTPALRLLVEREAQIKQHVPSKSIELRGDFATASGFEFIGAKSTLAEKIDVVALLEQFAAPAAEFVVYSVTVLDKTANPSPPFTTASLQQTLCSKLSKSAKQIQAAAARLYEMGKITYPRTDSPALSADCAAACHKTICELFGDRYFMFRLYKTKDAMSQEAHEAIRPTDMALENIPSDADALLGAVYRAIWKRTIESQMTPYRYKIFMVRIHSPGINLSVLFEAPVEEVIFAGFKATELGTGDPAKTFDTRITTGTPLKMLQIVASEEFSAPPSHFSESMLIKAMEKTGIGRPSTYASIVDKLYSREYVAKQDIPGTPCKKMKWTVSNDAAGNRVAATEELGTIGHEKNKMVVSEKGRAVLALLLERYGALFEYDFTADMESKLDKVLEGEIAYQAVCADVQALIA